MFALAQSFKLKQRAVHVWAEASRVLEMRHICDTFTAVSIPESDVQAHHSSVAKQLGVLMLKSHESCQKLYECSCSELDDLVACAMKGGALGARLTGAGWGGCIVVLVPNEIVPTFRAHLTENYYEARGLDAKAAIIESTPSAGADVYYL